MWKRGAQQNECELHSCNTIHISFQLRSVFSILHSSGNLFQQYFADSYVKTEGSLLNFIRNNQNSLRVDLYVNF